MIMFGRRFGAAFVLLGVIASSPASAQTFQEDQARWCGYNNAEYCWSTDGDGYGTPQDCINATVSMWCDSYDGPDHEWAGLARDYSNLRLYDLENYCSGRITCGP